MTCFVQAEVDAWNPLTDTVPVHAWIHPWLPFMGENLMKVSKLTWLCPKETEVTYTVHRWLSW